MRRLVEILEEYFEGNFGLLSFIKRDTCSFDIILVTRKESTVLSIFIRNKKNGNN